MKKITHPLLIIVCLCSFSCSLLSARKTPDYRALSSQSTEGLDIDQAHQLFGQSDSFALGKYQLKITPLVGELRSTFKLSEDKTCFYVELTVHSQLEEEASLKNFEFLVEDRWERLYQLMWLEANSPVSTRRYGATGAELSWSNHGIACSVVDIALNDYFEVRVAILQRHFPFYGVGSRLLWDYRDFTFPSDHPSYQAPRERQIQRYKGW